MSDIQRMWVHCHHYLRVVAKGQEFETVEACPTGHGPGIKPMDQYEHCYICPKSLNRDRPTRTTVKRLVRTPFRRS